MQNFIRNLRQIMPQVQNSMLPAFLFAAALLGFYFHGNISHNSMIIFHVSFFILNLVSVGILIYFNHRKPILYLLVISLSYLLINYFKKRYSLDYLSSPAYLNLCFFVPLNLCLFYFWPNRRLLTRYTVYWLLLIFTQFSVAEHLSAHSISLALNLSSDTINLNSLSVGLFAFVSLASFVRMIYTGSIMDSALFFAGLNIFAGFYYSSSPTALTIFFCTAAGTTCYAITRNLYHTTYYDPATGLASRNAFLQQAKSFPLKYSLGIVCIDNYEHFGKVFGRRGLNALTKMIANRLLETENENPVFRYSEDEFVIIFRNEDKKEGFERLENIRRAIASAEFMLGNRKKGLKLTVSCCVSEKKRSDDNSIEVLVRTRKALQKAYQFTQNVTSKA